MLLSKDLGGMARTPGATGPGFIDLARGFLSALHARINDPLWRLRVGRKKADAARAFAAWDAAVDECAREVLAEAPPEYTIAGHLLKVIDPTTGRPLSLAKLKAEMSIMYVAGFETTSHAITWSLGLLAAHPRAQAALAAELAAAGLAPTEASPQPRGFEWGDLGRLPYLLAVIKESLRLFQPAAGGSVRAFPRAPSSWSRSTPCPAPACCTAQTPAASAPSAG